MQSTIQPHIIIPCYNEHQQLREVVVSLIQCGYDRVIVVDDGSQPAVQQLLVDLPVMYIRHRFNLGQGAAIETGLRAARSRGASVAITFDADGQHDPEDIRALCRPIVDNEADIVFGSRFLEKKAQNISFTRSIALRMATWINYLFCGILLTDAHNGLRAFGPRALAQIRITESRMAHASEILFETRRLRLRYREVPVQVAYTTYSMQKGQRSSDGLKTLFDLVLHKLFR